MRKFVTALFAILVAGGVFAGFASSASAFGKHRPGCSACGPVAPTIHSKTIHTQQSLTRYHDVSVYKHVSRIHRVVNVTWVQPVIHVNDVTRIHHHTVVHTRNSYVAMTERLKPIRTVARTVRNYYDCGCGR